MPMPRHHPRFALLAGAGIICMGLSAGAVGAQTSTGQTSTGQTSTGQNAPPQNPPGQNPPGQNPLGQPQATGQPAPPSSAQHARRSSLADHFAAANTTHDGHLTLDQARAGMPMAARHFAAMDKTNKGYVTLADIHAYLKAQRAARHHDPAGGPASG